MTCAPFRIFGLHIFTTNSLSKFVGIQRRIGEEATKMQLERQLRDEYSRKIAGLFRTWLTREHPKVLEYLSSKVPKPDPPEIAP